MRYHPIPSISPSRKQLSSHQVLTGTFRCRQEPALFPPAEAKRHDFRVIFVTKCQFRMEKGKDNTSNGVLSHVPSRRAYLRRVLTLAHQLRVRPLVHDVLRRKSAVHRAGSGR